MTRVTGTDLVTHVTASNGRQRRLPAAAGSGLPAAAVLGYEHDKQYRRAQQAGEDEEHARLGEAGIGTPGHDGRGDRDAVIAPD